MKEARIYTDEFLIEDLHYALGKGRWNRGDGHTWIFDFEQRDEVFDQIVENFKEALERLFQERMEI